MLHTLNLSLTNNNNNLTKLGISYMKNKQYDMMKKCFDASSVYNIEALYYYGLYYRTIEKNTSKANECFTHAIQLDIDKSISDDTQKKKIDLIKKIKNNDVDVYYGLGLYYFFVEKNYVLMKLYFDMSIECNKTQFNLGKIYCDLAIYHEDIEKNNDLAINNYHLSIENNNLFGMYKLKQLCIKNNINIYDCLIKINKKNQLVFSEMADYKKYNIY